MNLFYSDANFATFTRDFPYETYEFLENIHTSIGDFTSDRIMSLYKYFGSSFFQEGEEDVQKYFNQILFPDLDLSKIIQIYNTNIHTNNNKFNFINDTINMDTLDISFLILDLYE